jgi:lysylphosphatidylglycerol synthetase-like protein (DUF2156 family)
MKGQMKGQMKGMTKGLLLGAIAGGTVDWLYQTRLFHRWFGAEAPATETDSLAPNQNWRLLEMLRHYGYEHQSFLSLYGGMQVWWSRQPEAAIVYRQIGSVAVVISTPLAAREYWPQVTQVFLEHCQQHKLDCLMLPIGAEFAKVAHECGMGLLCVGESGYFKLPEWKPAGDRAKKVRAGVNQARKAGIRIEPYDPNRQPDSYVRAEVETLCQTWLETREVDALGWLLELDPFKLSEHKRYFLARRADSRLEGMLACSPVFAREGWYLEDLIRRPDAERGVSELLVVEALRHLAAEGAALATLGTSPLAGVETDGDFRTLARLLKLIYRHFDAFYHFKALHRFKAKFAPSFVEKEFVAVYPPRFRLRLVFALINAFEPTGLSGVMISKLRRSWSRAKNNHNNFREEKNV